LSEYPLLNGRIHEAKGGTKKEKFSSFRKLYTQLKPRVVVSFDFFSSVCGLLSYRSHGFTFINGSIRHGVRMNKLSHYLRSLVCWLSPWVMANSIAGLRTNNLHPGKRRLVFYNGIEDKFKNKVTEEAKSAFLTQLFPGYSSEDKVIISIANFNPVKDYFTVLNALAEYKGKNKLFYLVIGEGPMRAEIEALISKLGLKDRVHLMGKTSNVPDYLAVSDYLVHSSKGEGISNAILEAMYAGLPIIATAVGGTPEIVYPGSSALFSYKDKSALNEILASLDSLFGDFDPESPGYQQHLAQFSVASMSTRFFSILNKVGIKE
jgi:glycosyltransferase involved in cell wall biosynthesis